MIGIVITAICTVLTALSGSGVIVALINRGEKRRRDEELHKITEERGKLSAETEQLLAQRDQISVQAAGEAVRIVRGELNEAHTEIDKRDDVIERQAKMIEDFRDVTAKQSLRIGHLEWWVYIASQKFEQLGVVDMPPVTQVNGSGPH